MQVYDGRGGTRTIQFRQPSDDKSYHLNQNDVDVVRTYLSRVFGGFRDIVVDLSVDRNGQMAISVGRFFQISRVVFEAANSIGDVVNRERFEIHNESGVVVENHTFEDVLDEACRHLASAKFQHELKENETFDWGPSK